jgi:hypothetical protein
LPENLNQIKAEEENEKINQGLAKNTCFLDSFVGVWAFRPFFFLIKVNMHTLTKNLSQN